MSKTVWALSIFLLSVATFVWLQAYSAPSMAVGTGYGGIIYIPFFLLIIIIGLTSFAVMLGSFFKKQLGPNKKLFGLVCTLSILAFLVLAILRLLSII